VRRGVSVRLLRSAPDALAHPPGGDGSPFEERARLEWVSLDEALARCASGEIRDMKTEVGLRRLREIKGSLEAVTTSFAR